MSDRVEGSFQVSKWEENTYEDIGGGSKLTKVSIVQDFSGGLDATVSWEGQMFYREDGTAAYTGLQRFVGSLEGREGTFVAETHGGYDGTEATTDWKVITGSGTAALAGLEGTGTATAGAGSEGTFTFDYDIG
jgi:Protein of unknown function (DUF3224)